MTYFTGVDIDRSKNLTTQDYTIKERKGNIDFVLYYPNKVASVSELYNKYAKRQQVL